MGLADQMRGRSDQSNNDYSAKWNQVYQMINEASSRGRRSVSVNHNFFGKGIREQIYKSLKREGFSIDVDIEDFLAMDDNSFFGISSEWNISW